MNDIFRKFAKITSNIVGSPKAFLFALLTICLWGLTGRFFNYSDTWQLVINTATTIITFLMVFLIQNTQNRDAKAIHLKLDELIHGVRSARDTMIDLEELTDKELEDLHQEFIKIRDKKSKQK